MEWLTRPWPWYVAGPLIGLMVPALLWLGNRQFGVSSNLRHLCAAVAPGRAAFFRYDWRHQGLWNLLFLAGILTGGVLAGSVFSNPDPVAISEATRADLGALGVPQEPGLHPTSIYNWRNLGTVPGVLLMVLGGLLVGFGTAWAGGCTSGHGIMGLADLQLPSLIAVVGFFVGGLLATFVLLPRILGGF